MSKEQVAVTTDLPAFVVKKITEVTKKLSTPEKPDISDLTAEITAAVAQKRTRKVRLIVQSCCGCGCDDVKIERVVSYDSKFHDGDKAAKLLSTDKVL